MKRDNDKTTLDTLDCRRTGAKASGEKFAFYNIKFLLIISINFENVNLKEIIITKKGYLQVII